MTEPISVDGDVTYWTQAPAGQMPPVPTHVEMPQYPPTDDQGGTEPL